MGNLEPNVSIAVPIYNTEKYLRQCLDSLINQTLSEIEIILVNDGSTDDSEAICLEYAQRDPRIVLVNKENGGLASARQAALKVAKGQYFCVCDSDDWVDTFMYECLFNKAIETGADIVMCDYWIEYSDGRQDSFSYNKDIGDEPDLLDAALNNRLPCSMWNKLFKRDLFNRYSLSWEQGINQGEDYLMCLKIFSHPVSMVYTPIKLYHYRKDYGGNSYTFNITMKSFNQLVRIYDWSEHHIDQSNYKNGLFCQRLNIAFTGLRVKEGMTSKLYREVALNKIGWAHLISYPNQFWKKVLVFFAKLFGYKLGRIPVMIFYRFII